MGLNDQICRGHMKHNMDNSAASLAKHLVHPAPPLRAKLSPKQVPEGPSQMQRLVRERPEDDEEQLEKIPYHCQFTYGNVVDLITEVFRVDSCDLTGRCRSIPRAPYKYEIDLTGSEKHELRQAKRSGVLPARVVNRIMIILLVDVGKMIEDTVALLGCDDQTVLNQRKRFLERRGVSLRAIMALPHIP